MYFKRLLLFILSLALLACSTAEEKEQTLADIDTSKPISVSTNTVTTRLSLSEIKEAYYTYINNTSQSDKSQLIAINRLAALELDISPTKRTANIINTDEELKLEKTALLLKDSSLRFASSKGNAETLYQLAKVYDQLGQHNESLDALKRLVKNYPKSKYYTEAQFRIAENSFISSNYIEAEDAYTEVLLHLKNDDFYEKSLFKRGWSRYKQELYQEAFSDFIKVLDLYKSQIELPNNESNKNLNEYFRAVALSLNQLDGTTTLLAYTNDHNEFNYSYNIHSTMADLYVKQERYSDAVNTINEFKNNYPDSSLLALAHHKIINTWKIGDFPHAFYSDIEDYFIEFSSDAKYWKQKNAQTHKALAVKSAKPLFLDSVNYYHRQYLHKKDIASFNEAKKWYLRYLSEYNAYAKADKIYPQLAELFSSNNKIKEAIYYYELAAFDGELILDKKSAYSVIVLYGELYKSYSSPKYTPNKKTALASYIAYIKRYISLYATDKNTHALLLNAIELSFHNQNFSDVISLTGLITPATPSNIMLNINMIKARSYLEMSDYKNAELAYKELLASPHTLSSQEATNINNALALSLYRQAESQYKLGDIDTSLDYFSKITNHAPHTALAINGLFESTTIAMEHKKWNKAIIYAEKFKHIYPENSKIIEVNRFLSVAYLNSNQSDKAAKQLHLLATTDDDESVKKSALWQAAILYEKQQNTDSAIKLYREYAHTYKEPYPLNMEAMYKLTNLYKTQSDISKRYFWLTKIKNTDSKAGRHLKTDRTNFIASSSILDLAKQKMDEFSKTKLRQPLKKSLKIKKSAMQESIQLYGKASNYGIANITSESTYSIALIYSKFSNALLQSERPRSLNAEELEQYNILLEDQAFPFEEKAIEFHETNLSRVKDGIYNIWIKRSHNELISLFPVRFARKGKMEPLFND